MKTALIAIALPVILTTSSFAQGTGQSGAPSGPVASSDPIPTKFWKASLPGGDYMVALSNISSIARHTYVVDGAARVYEVTVADRSSAIARFYFIEAVTDTSPLNVGQVILDRAKSASKEASRRAGADDVWSQVQKNYPHSTHAKTMEFRFTVKSNIDSLYSSVARAWERGKGERFKVTSE
jgi:hypothetical protein